MGVRKRPIPGLVPLQGDLKYGTRGWDRGSVSTSTTATAQNADLVKPTTGIQVTESENHPNWNSRVNGRFTGDQGGPFLSTKKYMRAFSEAPITLTGSVDDNRNRATYWATYNGPFLPLHPGTLSNPFPPSLATSDSDLVKRGSEAIARVAPSNPAADLSVFLAETMKDGLPRLIGGTFKKWLHSPPKQVRKDLAGEYLNYEFGWKPFVSDLLDLGHAVLNRDKIWAQYEKDAGKPVRRSYEFEPQDDTISEIFKTAVSPWTNPFNSSLRDQSVPVTGQIVRTQRVQRRQWFSGAFCYTLPPQDGSLRSEIAMNVIQAKKILGASLTPEVVWNLAPWSWAIDWFSNTGDQLKNLSNWIIDGQILLYGYMMEHTIVTHTYTFVGPTTFRSPARPWDLIFVHETKKRIQASPYGFGISWDSLTPRQLAIAASVGVTRQK